MSKNKKNEPVPEAPKEPEFTLGNGEFEFPDSSRYVGEWKEWKEGLRKVREGKGTFINGPEKYDGSWFDDKMNGYGEYYFASGAIYKGNFQNNAFHGEGEYQFADGAKYTGGWQNNKMHGQGTYVDNSNNVYKGMFINGTYDSGDMWRPVR
jgi:hypothetical protein